MGAAGSVRFEVYRDFVDLHLAITGGSGQHSQHPLAMPPDHPEARVSEHQTDCLGQARYLFSGKAPSSRKT